jgi:DNA-binding protein HU-beta
MNKKELVDAMAKKAGVSANEANKVLDAFVDVVGEALKSGDSVQLVGFLSLKVSERAARQGINPRTGESISIPAKKVVKVKVSKALENVL